MSRTLYELIRWDQDWDTVLTRSTTPEGKTEASELGWSNMLPLHWACGYSAPTNVVKTLLDLYKDGASKVDDDGKIPLHYAVENGAEREVLQILLDAYPEGVEKVNGDGSLPLHSACKNGAKREVIALLLESYKGGTKVVSERGQLPLHVAIEAGADRETTLALIDANRDGACVVDENGKLPLHYAYEKGASMEVVQELMKINPDGIGTKDKEGNVPLSYKSTGPPKSSQGADGGDGSDNDEDEDDMEEEEDMNGNHDDMGGGDDGGGEVRFRAGSFDLDNPIVVDDPFHTSNMRVAGIESQPAFAASGPPLSFEALHPLLIACEQDTTTTTKMSDLISSYPNATRKKRDVDGGLPLHFACKKGARRDILELILKSNPSAATALDDAGNLPVHLLHQSRSTLRRRNDNQGASEKDKQASIELLLRAIMNNGAACRAIGSIGVFLPLHIACRYDVSLDVFTQLLRAYPDAATRLKVEPGRDDQFGLDVLEEHRPDYAKSNKEEWKEEFNRKSDLLFAFHPNLDQWKEEPERLKRIEGRIVDETKGGGGGDDFWSTNIPNNGGKAVVKDGEAKGNLSDTARRSWIWLCESDDHHTNIRHILHQLNRSSSLQLASIKMKTGQTVLTGASPQCARILRSSLLFVGRYDVMKTSGGGGGGNTTTTRPLHQSATCVVLRATDYKPVKKQAAKQNAEAAASSSSSSSGVAAAGTAMDEEETPKSENVVIKFMKCREQYQREKFTRLNLQLIERKYSPVVPILRDYDIDRIDTDEEYKDDPDGDARFKADRDDLASTKEYHELNLQNYNYALVMPEADRTLEDVYKHERPSLNEIRLIMEQIGKALLKLHEKNIVHGDIKPLNIVRLRDHMSLIDMDASCVTCDHMDFDDEIDYAGVKFSSGFVPPEMIARLDKKGVVSYNKYWEQVKERDEELWKKVKPCLNSRGNKGYVVKSFREETDDDDDDDENDGSTENRRPPLPYDRIRATPKLDIWSFGVLLTTLCTGEPLFKLSRDDDLYVAEDYHALWNWDVNTAKSLLGTKIEDELALDLIEQLLTVETNRMGSMTDVLKHNFFRPRSETNLLSSDLRKMKSGLLSLADGRYEIPSMFVLLPADEEQTKVGRGWMDGFHGLFKQNVHLYFHCSHDGKRVEPPVTLTVSKDWVRKVAPALKVGITMLQIALKVASIGMDIQSAPLIGGADEDKVNGYLEFVESALLPDAKEAIDEYTNDMELEATTAITNFSSSSGGGGAKSSSSSASSSALALLPQAQFPCSELTDEAYNELATKVKKEKHNMWKDNMRLVNSERGMVWVRKEYANLPEYR